MYDHDSCMETGPASGSCRSDPARASAIVDALMVRANKHERRDFRIAWARALPRILLGRLHWARVSGPVQATIAVLGQVGWHPVSPDKWIAPGGTEYAELGWSEFANAAILDELVVAFERAAWRSASDHFLGGGLETGIPGLEPARAVRRWLIKNEQWKEVKALDCVVCGGVWSDLHTNGCGTCTLCGEEGIDAFHRYWSCPVLEQHADVAVSSTQWMRRLFEKQRASLACLWGRGMVPAKLVAENNAK